MIIRLQKRANRLVAEAVTSRLQKSGFNVFIKKEDDRFIIAALGTGSEKINGSVLRGLAMIERIDASNDDFNENHKSFKEAWGYFADPVPA